MKFYFENNALSNKKLYSNFVQLGKEVEDEYKRLKEIQEDDLKNENNDNNETDKNEKKEDESLKIEKEKIIDEIYFEETIFRKAKTIKIDYMETKLMESFKIYKNTFFKEKLKKIHDMYGYSYYDIYSFKEYQILIYAHIIYILDSVIESLKIKTTFVFAYYRYYNENKNYDIYMSNMIKILTRIIESFFYGNINTDITINDNLNFCYSINNYYSIIKLMLYSKLKYLNNPEIKLGEVAICNECNLLFFRGNSRRKHCDREWCHRSYQNSRKRKERKNKV